MLLSLSIRNFILIESADIDLSKGLTVITGETGSGKSILIDSISFLFGGKFDTEIVIRSDSEFAVVTGEFIINEDIILILQENSIHVDVNSKIILMKRQHFSNGRKKFFINDQQVTQKLVENVAEFLCSMSLQHSHTLLVNASNYIDFLDSYGKLLDLRKEVGIIFKELEQDKRELNETSSQQQFIYSEIEYLRFSMEELLAANLKQHELKGLIQSKNDLGSVKKNHQTIQDAINLFEQKDILSSISQIEKILNKAPESFKIKQLLEYASQSYVLMNELFSELHNQQKSLDDQDISEIEKIEERIFLINDLARKHKIEPDHLLEYTKNLKEKIEILEQKVSNINNLEVNIEKLTKKYDELSVILSEKRCIIAKALSERVIEELNFLEFKEPIFEIAISADKKKWYSSKGIDNVEFLFSSNVGIKPYSLEKIGSGGECARIMLALSVCMMDANPKPIIIFDEIDSGVSGKTAHAIGEKMKTLGQYVQVIAITHHPQVASQGNFHVLAYKSQNDGITKTTIRILSKDERVQELARIISGKNITESAIKTAEEYLL